ncbi:Oidioi.mRNA.OKI2018_I69.chr2.g6257.t1.cds [Oikopleura dioica]|uniref:Oidioi.mRNA.OKI2018_I69.chr2.g6257.t1.cds n=1 Tax=Oikopleura dioica TaxID=34765 RepID=A0ABN7T9E2_OIKDI|nr:Oidioi.mRNA.OKI2018_I69.chr2.g6257.t1.cds [Oikopleura dioica]
MSGSGTVNLKDYFKNFDEKLIVRAPHNDDADITSATRLLEERREMAEVEHALVAQKEEFQMRMESLQQRTEELERKEKQLKESLLKFDKFLKENDAKRARAIKKTAEEREMCRIKDKEIVKLEKQQEELISRRALLNKKLEKHEVFAKFMQKVLDSSEEFSEDNSEQERTRLLRFTEEKNNQILHYNNQLAQLQTKLDKAQSNAVKWESKWTHIQNTAAKKTLLLGRIKIATHNLYQLVCKHSRGSVNPTDNTVVQLERIQTFIQDLTQITNEIRRQEAEQREKEKAKNRD